MQNQRLRQPILPLQSRELERLSMDNQAQELLLVNLNLHHHHAEARTMNQCFRQLQAGLPFQRLYPDQRRLLLTQLDLLVSQTLVQLPLFHPHLSRHHHKTLLLPILLLA